MEPTSLSWLHGICKSPLDLHKIVAEALVISHEHKRIGLERTGFAKLLEVKIINSEPSIIRYLAQLE